MPPLSIWYTRVATVHLLTGFTIGALMLANKGVAFAPWLWRLRPAHMELLLLGWLVQFAMGVAFWIVPRRWEQPRRGNVIGARIALVLLNAGVVLVVLGSLVQDLPALTAVGRLLELLAALAFVSHIWPRVVGREG
ncbi:MAG: hypothetical protein R3272_08285 [Candidatus Promineifilaceae bacterium]|nr:hypothetical protein [Candidatus Promineifilaceae bacterium]